MIGWRRGAAALLLGAACTAPLAGQSLTRPAQPWETITTAHFRFHYPAAMREWVQPVARRMESYAAAVNAMVGSAPGSPVTVMVEDPSNAANGFAVPLLGEPVIFLWPTPPAPGPTFGAHRGWGEILAIHEYAHIAHLTVPTRSPGERRLWSLAPVRVGPVARRSPAWVIEGYATLIEGRLTGNGRPHSPGRAAVLRQWALEGQLPKYAELNATSPYLGGAMRYLVGSAFLEWLAERKGEESLQHLWRRMSARQARSFGQAFQGVYGAPPDEMYGAFFTDVMEKAFEARRALREAGLIEGELVQRLAWGTDEPAVSPDGKRIAIVLRQPREPARVVIWSTDDAPDTTLVAARRRMLERDPRDVAPFDSFPPRKRALATLRADRGRSHESPRWFADGERLLVSRDEPLGDGASRPDLFIWNARSGSTRRLTHGAGIRAADPAPDGRTAAGVRCANGICDLVRVDVATGNWVTLAPGSPFIVWHRPRFSPDGQRVAASVQRDGRWDAAVVDATSGAVDVIAIGDGASRHSPAWTPDGRLVVVSERGGIPNLEWLDPSSRSVQTLTRVTGSVAKPEVGRDGRVWFLALHARGNDLRRIPLDPPPALGAGVPSGLSPALSPVAPPLPGSGLEFPDQAIQGPVGYGLGPRGWLFLPAVNSGPDGSGGLLMLSNTDPVGRWTNVLQGGYGWWGAWRGASASTAWRRFPVQIESGIWYTDHSPSEQRAGAIGGQDLDSRYAGFGLALRAEQQRAAWGVAARAGASAGRIDASGLDGAARRLAFGDVRVRLSLPLRDGVVAPHLTAHASAGETGGESWTRGIVSAGVSLGSAFSSLRVEGTRGVATRAGPGEPGRAFEQFVAGGGFLPFVDNAVLSQRLSLPSVPTGYTGGQQLQMLRGTVRVAGLQPYVVFIGAGDPIERYHRIYGVEEDMTFSGLSFVGLPTTRIRFGLGYSLDEPFKGKVWPYVSVTYRP